MSLIPDKKFKSIVIENGKSILLTAQPAIGLMNIIINKKNSGNLIISAKDEQTEIPILFIDKAGTFNFNFDGGISLWKGANLVIDNQAGTTLIFLGYLNIWGSNKTTWGEDSITYNVRQP